MFICILVTVKVMIKTCPCHKDDICGIGRIGSNSLINGNFTYQGIDSSNQNRPYWFHVFWDVSIEYAFKYYGTGHNYYVLKPKNSNDSRYGYCNINNNDAYYCDHNWMIFTGEEYQLDEDFVLHYCSYFTVKCLL